LQNTPVKAAWMHALGHEYFFTQKTNIVKRWGRSLAGSIRRWHQYFAIDRKAP